MVIPSEPAVIVRKAELLVTFQANFFGESSVDHLNYSNKPRHINFGALVASVCQC